MFGTITWLSKCCKQTTERVEYTGSYAYKPLPREDKLYEDMDDVEIQIDGALQPTEELDQELQLFDVVRIDYDPKKGKEGKKGMIKYIDNTRNEIGASNTRRAGIAFYLHVQTTPTPGNIAVGIASQTLCTCSALYLIRAHLHLYRCPSF